VLKYKLSEIAKDGLMNLNVQLEEKDRKRAILQRFRLLDKDIQQDINTILSVANALCGTPIALLSLVDAEGVKVVSSLGCDQHILDWHTDFSSRTIESKGPFVVSDALHDARFLHHPLVTGEPKIQFYAGVPLINEEIVIGTLCVMDQVSRELSPGQQQALIGLGRQAERFMELGIQNLLLREANEEVRKDELAKEESEFAFSSYFHNSKEAVFLLDPHHTIQAFNRVAKNFVQTYLQQEVHVGKNVLELVRAEKLDQYKDRFEKALEGEETCVETKASMNGLSIWCLISYLPLRVPRTNKIVGVIVTLENIDKRKKAEEALRESKQQIADIAENIPNGGIFQFLMEADNSQFRFQYVSAGVAKIFDRSPEEILQDPSFIFNFIYPDATKVTEETHYSREHLSIFDYQYQFLVNGEIKWVHTKSKPKRLQDGSTQWDGLSIDITEQKKAFELLEKTKQDLQAVISTIPDLLFRFDKHNRYVFCHAGDSGELLLPVDQMVGKRIDEVMPPSLAALAIDSFQKVRKSGEIEVFEYFLDLPEKGRVWFEARIVRTNAEEVMIMVRNITERKQTEAALQESEANLHTVFNNTADGYYLFNSELKLLSFNRPARSFTMNVHHKELEIGSYFFDYFPEKDKAPLRETMANVLKGQMIHYDRKFVGLDGEENWYYIRYSPISNKVKEVIGVVMTVEDITERKKNEIELSKSFELVTEQNKRLLNFSYIVSHNLRSHTSNIKSILDVLNYADSEEERKEMLGILRNVSDVLDRTIRDLNDVVSIHTHLTYTSEPLNLKEYVERTILVLGKQIASKKAIVNNTIPDTVTILYTAAYLDSILLNFVSNAIKYSHPDRDPVVTISCAFVDNRWVLIIEDNGIGIDLNKNGDKLFGMYKTFHSNSDARGIGLFISKNQIEAMGGRIEVESEVGKGTTFKIYMRKE
jgi:PAS domain S-box-containing protein